MLYPDSITGVTYPRSFPDRDNYITISMEHSFNRACCKWGGCQPFVNADSLKEHSCLFVGMNISFILFPRGYTSLAVRKVYHFFVLFFLMLK